MNIEQNMIDTDIPVNDTGYINAKMSIALDARLKGLFSFTPIQKITKSNVEIIFKLECMQPSGSFKDRGISHMITNLAKSRKVELIISSSGGNAGLSVATVCQKLNLPAHIYVPITTNQLVIDKLKSLNASVFVGGENWNQADNYARVELANNVDAVYIPPFDDPLLWDGHSSIIEELEQQTTEPDAIILSVGGGGLLKGVQLGLENCKVWKSDSIKVFAVETEGASSFALLKKSGPDCQLQKISTIASSLGALKVIPSLLETSVVTESLVVTDKHAVKACSEFYNEMSILVEPACGTALSLIYNEELFGIFEKLCIKKVIVIVCGGSVISLDMLNNWIQEYL